MDEAHEAIDSLLAIEGVAPPTRLAAQILLVQILNRQGQWTKAVQLARQQLPVARKCGDSDQLINLLVVHAQSLVRLGRLKEVESLLSETLALVNSMGVDGEEVNWYHQCRLKLSLGELSYAQGDFDKALTLFEQVRKEYSVRGTHQGLAYTYLVIGRVFYDRGDLERALELLNKAHLLSEEVMARDWMAEALHLLGLVYQSLGDQDWARTYFHDSLALLESLGNHYTRATVLGSLLQLELAVGNLGMAWDYLHKLERFAEGKSENVVLRQYTQLYRVILLKRDGRLVERSDAMVFLQQLLNEPHLHHEVEVLALLHLADLLLFEVRVLGCDEALEELEEVVDQLLSHAKNRRSYSLLVESYLLRSRLALIARDDRTAQALLTEAYLMAEENQLLQLQEKVRVEEEEFMRRQDLLTVNSLQERLQMTELGEVLNKLVSPTGPTDPTQFVERPVSLLMISHSGVSVFSHNFADKPLVNEHLIGGFLTAINSVSKEAFSVSGSIERVSYQGYTLLIRSLGSLMVCYVFEGASYYATIRLQRLVEKVGHASSIMCVLEETADMSSVVVGKTRENLQQLVESIIKPLWVSPPSISSSERHTVSTDVTHV